MSSSSSSSSSPVPVPVVNVPVVPLDTTPAKVLLKVMQDMGRCLRDNDNRGLPGTLEDDAFRLMQRAYGIVMDDVKFLKSIATGEFATVTSKRGAISLYRRMEYYRSLDCAVEDLNVDRGSDVDETTELHGVADQYFKHGSD